MIFEWDAAKSESNQLKHGISFEEVRCLLERYGYIVAVKNPTHLGQELMVFRDEKGEIFVAVAEKRGDATRLITAYKSRKMRKKYGR